MAGGCDLSLTDGVCGIGQCSELGCVDGTDYVYRQNCWYIEDQLKVWGMGGSSATCVVSDELVMWSELRGLRLASLIAV